MNNISNTLKQDDALMKNLDIKTIQRLICYTDKGMLCLQIRKGEQNYHLTLDSVPLPKEQNAELMALLFPIPKQEVSQVQKTPQLTIKPSITNDIKNQILKDTPFLAPKKRGRPVGSARTK